MDYQTGRAYPGAAWHDIRSGQIPIVLLVRQGAVIPHIAVAQHTAAMNWSDIELRVFAASGAPTAPVNGLFALPDGDLERLELRATGNTYTLTRPVLPGKVRWRVTVPAITR
jgi:alpha-D-xyloside xylohydrolase